MSPLELAGDAFGLLSVVLFRRQSAGAWPTGIVNSVLFLVMFAGIHLYADAVLQVGYVVLSLYGWWYWLHPQPEVAEVPITRITLHHALALAAATVVAALAWGTMLSYTDQQYPYWNSLTVAMSVAATWLLSRKILENWPLWLVADLVMVGLYAASGVKFTAALYLIFAIIAVVAWREWAIEAASQRQR